MALRRGFKSEAEGIARRVQTDFGIERNPICRPRGLG